jgi:sulfite exporter TauE/SafE
MALVLAVLLASLLGSVHCAAMCGAFVCFYAASGPAASRRTDFAGHAAYNLGRLVSYLTLGAVAGTIGAALDRAGVLAGLGKIAAIAAGAMIVVWGIHAALAAVGARMPGPRVPAGWQRAMGGALERVRDRPPIIRAAVTGLVTTLLPCGWLYAFTVTAAGTGTPLRSMLVMFVFWLGTLPMMVAVGLSARRFFGPWRQRLPLVSASLLVMLGLFSIASHLDLIPQMRWTHQLMAPVPSATGSPVSLPHAH